MRDSPKSAAAPHRETGRKRKGRFMRIRHWLQKCFSKYGFVPLVAAFGYNCLVYFCTGALAKSRTLHRLDTVLDQKIPLVDWTILIYLGCYVFWMINYTLIYRESRERAYRFFIGDFLSRTVCLIFFLIYPTTLTRPEITGSGMCCDLLRLLYWIDAPVNLFPSIHCLVSWNCYLGLKGSKTVPDWYRRVSAVLAFSVFVSTLTTKQHVIIDVAGGVLLSEITCRLAMKTEWWHYVERGFDKAGNRIFPGGETVDGEEGASFHRVL